MDNLLFAIAGILNSIFEIYSWLLIGRVIISWVNPDPYNPIVQFLIRITEPVLEPIRNAIPSFGGIDLSVKVLLFFSIVTIMSLWTLMSWGIYYFDASKLQFLDIFPKVSIVVAMVYILETFFGWETVANLAEETKDASKVIPKVMMIGTVAVIILAIGVVSVALGAVPHDVLANSTAPLTNVAEVIMGSTGALIITALIFLNIFGGAAAWIITAPRLIFALARDGLLPSSLGKVHPRFQKY